MLLIFPVLRLHDKFIMFEDFTLQSVIVSSDLFVCDTHNMGLFRFCSPFRVQRDQTSGNLGDFGREPPYFGPILVKFGSQLGVAEMLRDIFATRGDVA